MSPSTTRMSAARTPRGAMPAKVPSAMPATAPSATEPSPTSSAGWAAVIVRERMSRPNWSQPNGCARLGAANRAAWSIAAGS